jgi:hypothetical protein
LWVKAEVVQEEKGPKLVAREVAPLEAGLPKWPERLEFRLQAAALTRETLVALKDLLARHPGPVPGFLHFLAPGQEEAVLALPPELSLTPSDDLAAEVNRLLGYPALSL